MLTNRDFEILDWIKKYKAITIEQCQFLFFNGSYEAARRRLSILEKDYNIKSYISRASKQKVYYLEKKISDHDIYILDYLKELKKADCKFIDIKIKPRYLRDLLIPDAFVKFKFNKYTFNTLLEVDYMHPTEELKLNTLYEKLARESSDYEEFNNNSFVLVVSSEKATIRYNSKNYDSVYTDLKYNKLIDLLGIGELIDSKKLKDRA